MPRRTRGFKWDNRLKKQYVAGTEITYGGTGGSITSTDNPPGSPQPGDTWFDTSTGSFYIYYDDGGSQQWVGVGGRIGATGPAGSGSGASSGSSSVSVSTTAPNSPTEGDMWFNSELLETYIYYNSQWVISNPSGGGGSGTTVYATLAELPLTNVTNGAQAFVSGNNRLYIWNGTGWYNIALINTAPTITGGGAGSYNLATDGTPTVITLTAADPEELPITWTYSVTSGSLTNGGGVTATVSQADNVFTITPTTTEAYAGTFSLTFTASDGVNIATDVNSFSLQFTVANSEYTTLLLKANASSSDNQVDASTNGLTVTEYGDITSTAFTPYHPKTYSTYFDGTGDYLVIDDTAIQTMSSSGFCFEMWVYGVPNGSFLTWNVGSGVDGFYIGNGGDVYVSSDSGSWDVFSGVAIGLTANQWNHLALTWDTTTYRYLVNGSVVASTANSTAMSSSGTAKLGVGATATGNVACTNEFYVRDLRFTNGDAVYTGSYTVPSEPLTVDSNTALLICSEPYLKDVSGNDCSITINTAIEQRLFSPYEHGSYIKSSHGGSVHFDGTGDYLTVPSDAGFAFGTGDFTVEGWVYRTATPTYSHFVDFRGSNNNDYNPVFYWKDNLIHYTNNNTSGEIQIQTSNAIGAGVWAHLAIVRSSNTLTVYVNGTASGSLSYTTNVLGGNTVFIGNRFTNTLQHSGYISDLRVVSSAVYTSDFTPPTEPLTAITNTQLLTCTNKNSIWDDSSGKLLTLVGDTTASTTQTKYSSSSIYFDGTGDYVAAQMDDLIISESEDWTVEFWAYTSNVSADNSFITFGPTDSGTGSGKVGFGIYESGSRLAIIDFSQTNSNKNLFGNSSQLTSNTWHHLAFVKSGSQVALFIDGTIDSAGWAALASNITLSNRARAHIGGVYNIVYNGYLEDVRITKGLARYTANFIPPTGSLKG